MPLRPPPWSLYLNQDQLFTSPMAIQWDHKVRPSAFGPLGDGGMPTGVLVWLAVRVTSTPCPSPMVSIPAARSGSLTAYSTPACTSIPHTLSLPTPTNLFLAPDATDDGLHLNRVLAVVKGLHRLASCTFI